MKWEEITYSIERLQGLSHFSSESFLDIGCGSGRLIESLDFYYKTYDYIGIDESDAMIQEAKNRHNHRDFLVWDMVNISEFPKNQKFSSIYLIASFHHLRSEAERLETLRSIKGLSLP